VLSTGLATVALGLLVLAPRLPRLARRYDAAALAPIDGPPADAADSPLLHRLDAWVAKGTGHGATLLPWSRPAVPIPLAVAFTPASHARAVHRFGYHLAGYHQLTRRSRVGGILYRIGVQLRPLAWFLPRRADEPWDDAWLAQADAARLEALARWLPRRPTLIVLEGEAAESAGRVAQALEHAAKNGEQPVRLLILGKKPAQSPAGIPLTPL
jgi:hypothetical protein